MGDAAGRQNRGLQRRHLLSVGGKAVIDPFEQRLQQRLRPLAGDLLADRPPRSDYDLAAVPRPAQAMLKHAAVLAPLIRRPEGWTLLLTQRTADMPTHAGQIAFPGGRMQPEDENPVATALRETEEEVGLARSFVRPMGALDAYETVTGYHVTPIVAVVEQGFSLTLDPREVADVFETPLEFLMNPAHHERHERVWQGQTRAYYVMPWQNRFIWGATAGMIKALYDRLYGLEHP
jgi:8-oxo-dGTP pyrophosphatase MutT (NUDIX family)